jgi:hypothetical protein
MVSTKLTSIQEELSSQEVIQTTAHKLLAAGREWGSLLQASFQENNARWLVIKQGEDHDLLKIPLVVGLMAGFAAIFLVSSKRAALLAIAALFAHIHLAIEDEAVDEANTVTVSATRRSRRK